MKNAFIFFIFIVPLFASAQKFKVGGRIADHKTDISVIAEIIVSKLDSTLFTKSTDTSGNYSLNLEAGKYTLLIKAPDYFWEEVELDVVKDMTKDITIPKKIIENRCNIIRWTFFSNNSTLIKKEFLLDLNRLSILLIENPSIKLEIVGFADKKEKNPLKLATRRAEVVHKYLMDKGIPAEKLKMGENKVEESKDKNHPESARRVEYNIFD